MKPYTVTYFSDSELHLLERIRYAMVNAPDLDLGIYPNGEPVHLSCHIMARATGAVFNLEVQDGFFHPKVNHSWVLTQPGNYIDVAPVGIVGGPILVHNTERYACPGKWLYKPAETSQVLRYPHYNQNSPEFLRAIELVAEALRTQIK
jgi:hypothetical protein